LDSKNIKDGEEEMAERSAKKEEDHIQPPQLKHPLAPDIFFFEIQTVSSSTGTAHRIKEAGKKRIDPISFLQQEFSVGGIEIFLFQITPANPSSLVSFRQEGILYTHIFFFRSFSAGSNENLGRLGSGETMKLGKS
jgi:hypothetical protein